MSDTTTLPFTITSTGPQPQAPADLNAAVIAAVVAINPGYTILPALLIEDLSSTCTYSLAQISQTVVDLVNSISPMTANPWLLMQLGQIYGVPLVGEATNTQVQLVFSGTVGFVIPQGFVVGDGTYQYQTQEATIIETGGTSAQVTAIATVSGSFAVPPNTVTAIQTSVPVTITLTVTNPAAGTPGGAALTEAQYRSLVVQKGLAPGIGMTTFLKATLAAVANVQPQLISARLNAGLWEVIVGGGDQYAVANAIFQSVGDISVLTGSTLSVTGITQANPGVVTTDLDHNYATGQVVKITGIMGMTELNGESLTATVLSPTTFSIGVNTSSFTAWTGGGVVTPNLRNNVVTIIDGLDTYPIPYVIPPAQTATIAISWATNDPNFNSAIAISQLVVPAIVTYVNGLGIGQPINGLVLSNVFQTAVIGVLPIQYLESLTYTVAINGVGVSPEEGTQLYTGDPEGFFSITSANVIVTEA